MNNKKLLIVLLTAFVGLFFLFLVFNNGHKYDVIIDSLEESNSLSLSSLTNNVTVEGELDVNVQDQSTRLFTIPINRMLNEDLSLASIPLVNGYDLTLVDASALSVGDKISFLEQNGFPQIYYGKIISIAGNVITLNDPVPFPFDPSITSVFTFDNQLNIDGSVTPVVFSLFNVFDIPVDVTRIIFGCTDDTVMDAGLFCAETKLSRGVLFRKHLIDDTYINYFNVVDNAKWALLAYDVSYIDNGKPPNDVYGFSTRLTFGGQNKIGVVIRLDPGESIELVVQDDLTGVSGASLMVEGHFTDDI